MLWLCSWQVQKAAASEAQSAVSPLLTAQGWMSEAEVAALCGGATERVFKHHNRNKKRSASQDDGKDYLVALKNIILAFASRVSPAKPTRI